MRWQSMNVCAVAAGPSSNLLLTCYVTKFTAQKISRTSGMKPLPPEQSPVQLPFSTQLAVQLTGQGLLLMHAVDSRVVPFTVGHSLPPAKAEADITDDRSRHNRWLLQLARAARQQCKPTAGHSQCSAVQCSAQQVARSLQLWTTATAAVVRCVEMLHDNQALKTAQQLHCR
jgi:hypothetical protein